MANAHSFIRSLTPSMLAPWFLAAVILLAPLASGYTWVSGGHAVEGHVHRHHLLEKLVPTAHHHTAPLPVSEVNVADGAYGAPSFAALQPSPCRRSWFQPSFPSLPPTSTLQRTLSCWLQ